jgi:AmmeMemoRadiSam system protein B/AmmeMemoRadiSam system protein A
MALKDDFDSGRLVFYGIIALVLIALLCLNYCDFKKHVSSNSQAISQFSRPREHVERVPAVAGIFYSADKMRLDAEVEHYLAVDSGASEQQPQILIVPHAGYEYSAPTAGKAYARLKKYGDKIKRVVLVGPSHRVAFDGIAASGHEAFITPLGRVPVNKSLVREIAKDGVVKVFEGAHEREHSIEVQLPFLQKTLGKFSILPLVYGRVAPETLARELKPFLGRKDTIIIFSADLSHYLDYDSARRLDGRTADMISQKTAGIEDEMSCGGPGINAALILARREHLHPELLDLVNSGDVKGGKAQVVGYGAWMFTPEEESSERDALAPIEQEERNLEDFAELYGRDMIRIARLGLEEAVLSHKAYSPSRNDYADSLFDKGASFVTLEKGGKLRGCIGTVRPQTAISHDIARNAYLAALEDGRFSSIAPGELKDMSITVSQLTDFERIEYANEKDLLARITPGIDGLILRDGNRQGLFLPSVWKQLPDRKEFLGRLKVKAGIAPEYWSSAIKVYKFRTVEVKDED